MTHPQAEIIRALQDFGHALRRMSEHGMTPQVIAVILTKELDIAKTDIVRVVLALQEFPERYEGVIG